MPQRKRRHSQPAPTALRIAEFSVGEWRRKLVHRHTGKGQVTMARADLTVDFSIYVAWLSSLIC